MTMAELSKTTPNKRSKSSPLKSPSKSGINTRYMEKWRDNLLTGEEKIPFNSKVGECQAIYKALGNNKKLLVIFCCGLKVADGSALINLKDSPWNFEAKHSIKPLNKDLTNKVMRRQKLILSCAGPNSNILKNKDMTMRPKYKTREQLIKWLNTWPIASNICIKFLEQEVTRVKEII